MFQKMLNFFVFGEDRKASNRKRSNASAARARSFVPSAIRSPSPTASIRLVSTATSSTSKDWPR